MLCFLIKYGQGAIPLSKLFSNNRQIVLLGNQQIYMADPMKKICFNVYRYSSWGVLNKDLTVRLDEATPASRYVFILKN
jgi:hypothetical protein